MEKSELHRILDTQKAHLKDGPLSLAQRKDWIDRLINSIIKHQKQLPEAISEDFSHEVKPVHYWQM